MKTLKEIYNQVPTDVRKELAIAVGIAIVYFIQKTLLEKYHRDLV